MLAGLTLAAHIAMTIGRKILELHNAGVGEKIINEINETIKAVHDVVDKHHTDAGLKADKAVKEVETQTGVKSDG